MSTTTKHSYVHTHSLSFILEILYQLFLAINAMQNMKSLLKAGLASAEEDQYMLSVNMDSYCSISLHDVNYEELSEEDFKSAIS